MNLLWFILIGIVAGYIAGQITRGHGFGLFVNLLIGIIGGVLGGLFFSFLGIATYGLIGSLFTATIGAILLLWLVSLLFGRKKTD